MPTLMYSGFQLNLFVGVRSRSCPYPLLCATENRYGAIASYIPSTATWIVLGLGQLTLDLKFKVTLC